MFRYDSLVRIHNVTVRNFRGITERTISLCNEDGSPRTLTVLVGPNMVGKTTLLDAIHMTHASIENSKHPKLRPLLDPSNLGLRPDRRQPIEVDITFSLADVERRRLAQLRGVLGDPSLPEAEQYWLRFRWPTAEQGPPAVSESRPLLSNQAFRGRATAMLAKKRGLAQESVFDEVGGVQYLDQHRSIVVTTPSVAIESEDVLNERAGREDPTGWLQRIALLDQKWNVATQGESSWSRVKRYFAELAAPSHLADIVSSDEGFDLKFVSGTRAYGAEGMSSGEQQVLRLVCNLVARRATRSVVLIDECELHLHPSWQRNLLHFMRHGGGAENQFIVTTHSDTLLDLLAPSEVIMLAPLTR